MEVCFRSNLTSSEWASWVQAIGSIVAIVASVWIAGRQVNKQHRNAMLLHARERRERELFQGRTLREIAWNCNRVADYCATQLHDRDSLHLIGEGDRFFERHALNYAHEKIVSIPLYTLPDCLVGKAMQLAHIVMQLRSLIDRVLVNHRKLNAGQISEALTDLQAAPQLVRECSNHIEIELNKLAA